MANLPGGPIRPGFLGVLIAILALAGASSRAATKTLHCHISVEESAGHLPGYFIVVYGHLDLPCEDELGHRFAISTREFGVGLHMTIFSEFTFSCSNMQNPAGTYYGRKIEASEMVGLYGAEFWKSDGRGLCHLFGIVGGLGADVSYSILQVERLP
jgi:hypothetical protein